jgi:hypothetical protein
VMTAWASAVSVETRRIDGTCLGLPLREVADLGLLLVEPCPEHVPHLADVGSGAFRVVRRFPCISGLLGARGAGASA